ncbi:unnamed protein product [Triticum turgidum subsp. durum]|uniref:Probable magnesium transporter n=1 Tax=Triticum turgidum subsp. durum TaxID=4567 RepID=A0A9R0YKK1_TRITD|nr:unnamed protein product [Triticum turgidum subsp. durum]
MGDWIIGALINIVGSVAINFGTNLLKLGHDQDCDLSAQVQREKLYSSNNQSDGKFVPRSVMYFQTWRIGILFFAVGNCLNFMSFAYAAQSLLAALGSIQFVSNIAFAYVVLNKTISVKVMVATTFIVFGNVFLVSFGNHQSPAGFWMARLNEGLSLFDAILIVPMFQIAWTFFSICTGFVYFQEYQVFDTLRIIMFLLGMTFVFIGISLLAPDENKVADTKDGSNATKDAAIDMNSEAHVSGNCRPRKLPMEETEVDDMDSFSTSVKVKAKCILSRAKSACSMSLGLGEETISASSVLAMPMVSSRTTGFRGIRTDRSKYIPLGSTDWDNL